METTLPSVGSKSKCSTLPITAFLLTLIASTALPASAATGKFIAHNTPRYVATAKNLGTEDAAKTMEVSLWLQPHNRAALDKLAQGLYDPSSPTYRHFLKSPQIAKQFGPTAAEAKTVKEFLESHNLKVVRTGPNNFFVHARGTVGDVENAFHVQLNNYQVRGKVIRSNDRDPYVDGAAGPLVRAIAGLNTGEYTHPAMQRPTGPPNAGAKANVLTAKPAGTSTPSDFFSSNCFDTTEKETFSTNNDGEYPIGTYKGNHLNVQSLTSAGCAYTPGPIATAYGLDKLWAKGFDGSGQTIGIIDWCGSSTILQDTNAFSAQFGLPLLTSSNFAITYIPTPSLCISADQTEINIDVEWAHAVAPGANINLIVPPSAEFIDIDEAEFTAITYGLANVISGSFGSPESFTDATDMDNESLISEIAAVSGISTNFSTGDDGDYSFFGIPATVSSPADSPYATGVGGVGLALNADNSIAWQDGWGNNEVLLSEAGFIADPPASEAFGFIGGAGGGASNCAFQDADFNCLGGFPKPWFQKHLPGKTRQLPDVAWLADPFTGVAILISVPGQVPEQVWQVWGGTSVACPMFSALWAIANQEAGVELGQAAPYLYSMPAGTIADIVPVTSKGNVTASIQESATESDRYTAKDVLGGSTPGRYVSAIWDYPSELDTSLVISFGMDCSAIGPVEFFGTLCTDPKALHTKVGWDNVTGVGVPNAEAFANAFAPVDAVKK